ncbi:MAG: hypothetical protein ABIG85_06480 [Chloroflexota bacterium]
MTATTLDRPGAGRAPERPPASRVRPPPRPPASPGPAISAPTSLLAASLAGQGAAPQQAETAPEEATWSEAFPVARLVDAGAAPPTDRGGASIHGIARPGALVRGSLLDLQRLAGNAAVTAALGCGPMAADRGRAAGQRPIGSTGLLRLMPDASAPLQRAVPPEPTRLVVQRNGEENEAKLREVQGKAMFALLPALAKMDPTVLADEAAARFVGGPRLIVAIRAVQQKGSWKGFATSQGAELAALPTDQIGDVMRFVGAPQDVGLYERDNFDGRFDGFVEPVTKTITLILKVKAIPVEDAGPTDAEMEEFKAGFKSTVETTWSGKGTVKPDCKGVGPFKTRAVVQFVEGGEHLPIKVYPASVRAGGITTDLPTGKRSGEMAADAGKTYPTEQYAGQPKGEALKSEQATAAHEFGHAIGIDHVRCKGEGICYGTNQEEWDDVMGGGMKLQRVNVGGAVHSDFAAFERIGERWGRDKVFKGAALDAKCNKWSGGG